MRRATLGGEWVAWLDDLPARCARLLDEWNLTPTGDPTHGSCSLVVPVRTADRVDAVLKVGFDGDRGSEHESVALAQWNGDGAVRLFRADPRRRALLLERLHSTDLESLWDVEACEIIAGFYARLHRPASNRLAVLPDVVGGWLDALATDAAIVPVPPRFVEQSLHAGRDLCSDPASVGTLIHADLHYGNVLAGDREPWLVIDPKPLSGDPHYEVAPLLWNRWEEMAGDVRGALTRRFLTVVDAAGLDEKRARDWVVIRVILNVHWAVEDARRARRGLDAEEREFVTRSVAIAKAVQP
ncbi:aminoglycoside resistance protein [Gordonia phthalatica]|uniref:Aminoglycoside resistance protein n=2 Tax=Gordonia phthalatica TaxID=1136941 RepID=A0A0N9NLZ2_9ACTN|nr:aminoglycoside resistance protein [Gordonia phthalatica]